MGDVNKKVETGIQDITADFLAKYRMTREDDEQENSDVADLIFRQFKPHKLPRVEEAEERVIELYEIEGV